MKSCGGMRIKKALLVLICGICVFAFDYLLVLPFFMETHQERALNVFGETYWWISALFPIVLVPLVMRVFADCRTKDWKYFLIFAGVQFAMLPILYWYVTEFDYVKRIDLTWIVLAGCVAVRTLVEIVAGFEILSLLERIAEPKETKES